MYKRQGQKVGLVGPSGAGKSTLFKLLLRFYDVEKGKILIDEQNISLIKQESLRRHIGTIQQESSLLHRSIRENINYGRSDATEKEIIDAQQGNICRCITYNRIKTAIKRASEMMQGA